MGRVALRIIVGLAIVAGSFWATLFAMDRLGYDPASATIEVLDATYGANCIKNAAGNATQYAAKLCGGAGNCGLSVDVAKMGDPAPGCAKDFSVKFRCGWRKDAQALSLPAEANGKALRLDCQKA